MLYDVVSRYFFNSPSVYAPAIVSFLTLGTVFFGASYSFQSGSQVFIEIVIDKLPPLPRKICVTIGYCLALFFVGVLMKESWSLSSKAIVSGWVTAGNVQIPSILLYGLMVLGCFLLFLSVVMALINVWTKKSSEEEADKQ